MRSFLVILIILMLSVSLYATEITDNIASDTTWDGAFTYYILNNITVNNGVRLTIMPGAIIKFYSGTSLTIHGSIYAVGNSDECITFTANTNSPSPGYWGSIYFDDPDTNCQMTFCDIEYGGDSQPMVKLYQAASYVSFNECNFRYSGNMGLDTDGATNLASLYNCSFSNCYGIPLNIWPQNYSLITGSFNCYGNSDNTIHINGGDVIDTTWNPIGSTALTIKGNLVVPDAKYFNLGAGLNMYWQTGRQLTVNGRLNIAGDSANRVYMTNQTTGQAWNGLYYYGADANCNISYATIENADSGDRGAVYIRTVANPFNIDNTIINNCEHSGIYINNADIKPTISSTTISNCQEAPISTYADNIKDIAADVDISQNTLPYIEVKGGTIVRNATWYKRTSGQYYLNGEVSVAESIALTLNAGTILKFGGGKSLNIYGSIFANGTVSERVQFVAASASANPGAWRCIYFNNAQASTLSYCTIDKAGYDDTYLSVFDDRAAIAINNSADILLDNCLITDSAVYGMRINTSNTTIINNTIISGSGDNALNVESDDALFSINNSEFNYSGAYPFSVYANDLASLDNCTYTGNAQQAFHVKNSETGNVTWPAFGVPLHFESSFTVVDETTLTIEAPNEFMMNSGAYINVYGKILANGTASNPITFSNYPGGSSWRTIYFDDADTGTILNYCEFSGGGRDIYGTYFDEQCYLAFKNTPNGQVKNCTFSNSNYKAIKVNGSTNLEIDNCEFIDNGSHDIYASNANHLQISNCTFDNSNSYPLYIPITAYDGLSNLSFTPATLDGIELTGGSVQTCTWPNIGLDLYLKNGLTVADGVVLTLSPGLVIKIQGGGNIYVEGAITANGTADEHILFTSSATTPSPGNWQTIYLKRGDAGNSYNYCDFEYGGRNIYGSYIDEQCLIATYSTTAEFSNCTFTNSQYAGVKTYGGLTFKNCVFTDNGTYGIESKSGVTTFGSNISEWNDINGNGTAQLKNSSSAGITPNYVYWGTTDSTAVYASIVNERGVLQLDYWTNAVHSLTYPLAFSAPANVAITISESTARISWDATAGATSYTLQAADSMEGTFSDITTGIIVLYADVPISTNHRVFRIVAVQ